MLQQSEGAGRFYPQPAEGGGPSVGEQHRSGQAMRQTPLQRLPCSHPQIWRGQSQPGGARRAFAFQQVLQQQNRRERQGLQLGEARERQRDACNREPPREEGRRAHQQESQGRRLGARQRVGVHLHQRRRCYQEGAPQRPRREARRQGIRREADSQRKQQVKHMKKRR